LRFFREAVFEHHADEERPLFPAVLASVAKGEEFNHVESIVERLAREHRHMEATWIRLEPDLKKLSKGQVVDVDTAAVESLFQAYREHASYEEVDFLPLCQIILSRNSDHLTALDLSLHMRHMPPAILYV